MRSQNSILDNKIKNTMKKILFLLAVVSLELTGCTKMTTNIPEERKLNYECTWTYNAYYVLKVNGNIIAKSGDSLNTELNRIPDFMIKSGDFVELIIKSLDATGQPDHSKIHGAIVVDGYKAVTNTQYGSLYLYR